MPSDAMDDVLDWIRSRYFGKYRGTVSDNADTTSRARLKVRVPAVLGDVELWAMPCVPYAGPQVGFHAVPPSGAGVWVEFEGGDPSFPIWTGCFWADGELPSTAAPGIKLWKTDAVTITLDDDAEEMIAENKAKSTLTLGQDVIAESGSSTLTVGSDGVVGESGGATHTVASEGVKSEASGNTHKVAAAGVVSETSGTGKVEVTSAAVKVNSGALEVM